MQRGRIGRAIGIDVVEHHHTSSFRTDTGLQQRKVGFATGFDIVFRKRALHPGATIGAHLNDKDEIYYVLSGRGELTLNGDVREVGPGDAILTRSGDRHALRQRGEDDLVIFIVFDEASRSR